ncbi:DUF3413 domain-containing protein [Ferrimonas marina]|uniref:DUF3413 domain-containing protein n=1 Tax=Ferrimonas marina TaxID=299255 RepID=UPI0013562D36|nr:DUF3413 domain-containing protein [Ferrimonas marina]
MSPLVLWGHWFTFANILLAILIASRYVLAEGWPSTLLGQVYLVANLIGHFSFLGFVVYLIALFPVTLLLPNSRILRGYAAVVATVALSALVFDTQIFTYYRLHLSPFVLDLASSDLNALLKSPVLLLLPVGLMALQLVIANAIWKRIHRIRRRRIGSRVTTVLVSCFVASHLVHIWADAAVYRPITYQDDMFPLHYPFTAKGFMARQGLMDDQTLTERVREATPTHQLNYPLAPMQCSIDEQPNVLMVIVEAWRADLVDQQTMPNLMAFAEQSHWFTQHRSGSNEYGNGIYSLLYSMLPAYEASLIADKKPPVVTEQLKAAGYKLAIFGSEELSESRSMVALLSDFKQVPQPSVWEPAEQDQATVSQLIEHLGSAQGPEFALATLNAPAYYSTPVGFVGIPTVRPEQKMNHAQRVLFNQYRQSLSFIDGELGRLLDAVDDNTLVILTGSHGNLFTTDGNANMRGNFSDPAVQVPMLVRMPGQKPRTITHASSHYGLVPALMTNLLQCDNPIRDYSVGESLYQPQALPYLVMGNDRNFAIKSSKGTTVINHHGEYRVYNNEYRRQRGASLDVPTLINMMEEGRRFLSH